MVLAFFSSADTIVNMNLSERFIKEVQIREAIIAYSFQTMIENIHGEVYSLMIDACVENKEEKEKLFNALTEFECIKKKGKWAMDYIESDVSFAQRLIAFVIVEGLFFSGSFCAIFWIKKKNLMNALCDSNKLIARDEGMHTDFNILLYTQYIQNKVSEEIVYQMFRDAVEIERQFICEALPCSLLGMNSDLMYQYIQFVADRLLTQLGYSKIWNVSNPFDFMESISVEGKTNFFENRVENYQNAFVLNKTKTETYKPTDVF